MAPSVVLVVAVISLALAWMFGVVRMLTNGTGEGDSNGSLDAIPVRMNARSHGRAPSLLGPRSPSFPG